ncbi:MAG: response regulator [Acetobacteraceae bacterium]|nr:response regulator [Acetobacteraceae bacterium]
MTPDREAVPVAPVFGRRLRASAAALVVALPLLLWGWLAYDMRQRALEVAKDDMRRVSAALAEQVVRLLDVQAMILDLADREAGPRPCAELRADARLADFLATAARRAAQTEVAWVLDEGGFQCAGSDPARLDDMSRAFRDYFSGARGAGPGRYSVDRGVIGIPSGTPAFTISRRRGDTDAFTGVVIAAVGLRDLVASWRELLVAHPTHRVALFRADGALIARSFEPLVAPPNPAAERTIAASWQTQPEGARLVTALVDGTERVSAWRTIPRWGVVVTSSIAKAEALRPWWRFAILSGAVAALASALIALVLGRFARKGQNLERVNRELERRVARRTGELQASEARWRSLFERMHEGLFLGEIEFGPDGRPVDLRFLGVNAAFEGQSGLPATVVGRRATEAIPGLEPFWIETYGRVVTTGEPAQFEHAAAALGRWFEVRAYRTEPGRFAALFLDITDRKASEERLRRSDGRFRAAVEAVSGIVWTNSPSGEMEGEQPGWAALTGQTFEEYQGHGWARAVHPEDAGPSVEAWDRAVAERRTFVFEHRVRRRDGAWRRFAIRAIPILGADGAILEWVGVHTDVTEQREAEAVLARGKEELERLVEERTRDLQETQARLAHAQRMEALGQLAGGIAHDFNNVLQAVGGGAALIERKPGDPAHVRRLARMVADAAERGSAITRRLLAFSRRGDLRAEALDPVGLLMGLREVFTHTLGSGIGVRVEATAAVPPILADKGQLETVLVNLATNARDAMGGNGTLTLAAAAESLRADAPDHPGRLRPGDYVRLSVIDTGAGMPPDILARASEPFFTTKPQGQGTGLGLAMARGFAQQSGGGFAIASEPGRGTAVTLWLPVATAGVLESAAPAEDPGAGQGGRARRILLVDDDAVVREVTASGLEAAGFTVLSVAGGDEALARLDGGAAVDVLICDLSMPGVDGLETIREAQRRRPGLPAILLTGFATNAAELAVGGALSGSFSLLRKPVTAEALAERVDMLLEEAGTSPQAW